LRRYVDPGDPGTVEDRVPALPTAELSAFFGGFFTGEGSFSLRGRAAAGIHLRADDADLVRDFHHAFGVGRVSVSTSTGVSPSVRWTVCRRAELLETIAIFDAAVLRGRKRREFEAWRIGAAEYARGRHRDEAVIKGAAESLARARAYIERPVVLPARDPPTEAYIDVLRAFAHEVPDGSLTCSAYAHARAGHPEWPTRNTLALAFGTWEQALEAAGLGARASSWRRDRAGLGARASPWRRDRA
jgi:hypothetical protein